MTCDRLNKTSLYWDFYALIRAAMIGGIEAVSLCLRGAKHKSSLLRNGRALRRLHSVGVGIGVGAAPFWSVAQRTYIIKIGLNVFPNYFSQRKNYYQNSFQSLASGGENKMLLDFG